MKALTWYIALDQKRILLQTSLLLRNRWCFHQSSTGNGCRSRKRPMACPMSCLRNAAYPVPLCVPAGKKDRHCIQRTVQQAVVEKTEKKPERWGSRSLVKRSARIRIFCLSKSIAVQHRRSMADI